MQRAPDDVCTHQALRCELDASITCLLSHWLETSACTSEEQMVGSTLQNSSRPSDEEWRHAVFHDEGVGAILRLLPATQS